MMIKDYIKNLIKQQEEVKSKLQTISYLGQQFPDLEVHTNRWKRERFMSKLVNNIANDYEIDHGCGCCPDSPLQLSPYIELNGHRIFFKSSSDLDRGKRL